MTHGKSAFGMRTRPNSMAHDTGIAGKIRSDGKTNIRISLTNNWRGHRAKARPPALRILVTAGASRASSADATF